MNQHQAMLLAVFIVLILLVRGTGFVLRFKSYCDYIAKLDGREKERASLSGPDASFNFFELEQFGKIGLDPI